jgi:ComF family protein
MKSFQLFNDFISLFYPEVCLCCGESLSGQEEFICTSCMYRLPKTNFHLRSENELMNVFWGRADIKAAAAYCYFQKGNPVQVLVHELKYHGKKELGIYLGKWYGHELKQSTVFESAEVVIPVPLHKKKLKRRGYNQSAFFARGLAESMGLICLEDSLFRLVDTTTQTRKTKGARWENVKEIFRVADKEALVGKHILLVDDIITTGATVEACIHPLAEIPVASVSVASIGYASF